MVNSERRVRLLQVAVGGYVAVVVAALAVLVLLSVTAPAHATSEAWGHAVIVVIFVPLLVLRVRGVAAGRPRAPMAVMIIGIVVGLVNIVEAVLPHVFPFWMRLQMIAIVVIMCVVVVTAFRLRRAARTGCPAMENQSQ